MGSSPTHQERHTWASVSLILLLALVLVAGVACRGRRLGRQAPPTPVGTMSAGTNTAVTPTPIPSTSPSIGSPSPIASAPASTSFPWIHAANGHLVDASGQQVLLRGFVTITNNTNGSTVNYTLQDYQRMRLLGADYQSIRIGVGSLGAWPGTKPNPEYLQQLDRMVAMAKQVGMYTEFKLTTYDVAGFQKGDDWGNLWRNQHGEQAALINGWKQLWTRYANEPAVVGYDLLNEPHQGSLRDSSDQFEVRYLTPFYQKTIDALHAVDQRHLAFVQPPGGSTAYRVPIQRDQIVYAPHFYPNLVNYLRHADFSTADYAPTLRRFLDEAQIQKAPLFIGEYGMPWRLDWDGNTGKEQQYEGLEEAASRLFDENQLSYSRPWFADDRSAISLRGIRLGWGVIRGQTLQGPERTFITSIVARPYPERVDGTLKSFQYDFNSHAFTLNYVPASAQDQTLIRIPGQYSYANGFTAKASSGVSQTYAPNGSNGLTVQTNASSKQADPFSWTTVAHGLRVGKLPAGKEETIQLQPR